VYEKKSCLENLREGNVGPLRWHKTIRQMSHCTFSIIEEEFSKFSCKTLLFVCIEKMGMNLVCRFVCWRIVSLSLSQPSLKDTSDMNSAFLAGNKRGSCEERNQTKCGPLCLV